MTAGHLIIPFAKEHNVRVLPVDSEHSAVFQALHGEDRRSVKKLSLLPPAATFRGRTREELAHVTLWGYPETSKLGYGTEDHGGFRDSGEQGTGGYGSQMAV